MNKENQELKASSIPLRVAHKILSFTDEQVGCKFMSMGVLPGSILQVVRIAPLAGGYYLKVDGQNLAVRKGEAESIVVG